LRKEFSNIIEKLGTEDDKIVFLTGDLGFNALENLQKTLGPRFINVGIAEQTMVGIAAGMAHKGYKVFCYSIAPFTTFRCLEQIRIDVCFHKLPVFIVGNGGGYGYGIMGSTHHALSDIACMSSLPDMTCYVPAFSDEVELSVKKILAENMPAYLRLEVSKNSPVMQEEPMQGIHTIFDPEDAEMTVIALGPIINNVLSAIENTDSKNKIALFSAVKIPFDKMNDKFISSIRKTKKLLVVEEHVARGGFGEYIALDLLNRDIHFDKFQSLCAMYYPNGLYGNQGYHQVQSGLDAGNIQRIIKEWLNG